MTTATQYRNEVAGRAFERVTYRGQPVSNVKFIAGVHGDCVTDVIYAWNLDEPYGSPREMVSMDLRYLTVAA